MGRLFFLLFVCVGGAGAAVGQEIPRVMVSLLSPGGESLTIEAEVAATPHDRARGLMYRPNIPERTGMLFLWPRAAPVAMWMKNTPASLDMLFIREHKVVGIIEQTVPFSEVTLSAGGPVDTVLEVRAGTVAKNGITAGWRVEWSVPAQSPVE